jgi:hypothetical protein
MCEDTVASTLPKNIKMPEILASQTRTHKHTSASSCRGSTNQQPTMVVDNEPT